MSLQPSNVAMEVYDSGFRSGWTRDPDEDVDEWADGYRILSNVASAEPGQWRTSRTPYLREPMRELSPRSSCRVVVLMFAAQTGKTECGNNWVGYTMHRSPAGMLMVLPTVDMAKRVSKQRIAPMIEATPVLREKVKEARSRDSGNTVQVKEFEGGILILTGANSAAGLRSMPIPRLFLDEVDAYPGDVEGEGDPIALALARSTTFVMAKALLTGTPTIKGLSRIEKEYLLSDQRHYFVPCPHCGHMDWIRWENIRWEKGQPETAKLACMGCEQLIEERYKTQMLTAGEWRSSAVGRANMVGFHLSALYSPLGWKSWATCVTEFVEAKDDPFKLKTWVNVVLAETFEERGDSIEAGALKARLETYDGEVPHGVAVLVAAVDVQGDRLEVVVKGFGIGEESWLIAFDQILGDPARTASDADNPSVWFQLDAFLSREFTHASGRKMRVLRTVIDSGGHHTEEVYRYCSTRVAQGVYAIKGGSESGKPLVTRPTVTNRYRVALFVLCVDTGKEVVMSRLLIGTPSPGYIHLPSWLDDEYLAQMTAEKSVRRYVKGRGAVREWVKVRERNEAFDLEVYALAALHICGQAVLSTLPERVARLSAPVEKVNEAAAAPEQHASARPVRPRSSWVSGWRN